MGRPEVFVVPLIAAVLVACSATPAPTASVPGPDAPASLQRTFGPDFPAVAPSDGGARIDAAVLSHDRRTLSVAFIGAQAYAPANPCSEDYGAWAAISGDTLNVQVDRIEHPDQATFAPGSSCTADGHQYLFQILLRTPFAGSTVRDVASGPLWIAPPDGVVELAPVPSGWRLTSIVTNADTREIDREYRPGPDSPGDDNRYLYLGQVLGGPSSYAVDVAVATRSIRGQEVSIGRNGDVGYIANWWLGGDTLTLITYDAALTVEAFVALANAVAVPPE